jgi:hypothetical protein
MHRSANLSIAAHRRVTCNPFQVGSADDLKYDCHIASARGGLLSAFALRMGHAALVYRAVPFTFNDCERYMALPAASTR